MISIDRKYLGVMMEAGYVYMGMKRFKEAREMFEGLRVLSPDSEAPLVALGNVEFCEGKLLKASRCYMQALKVDPSSVYAKVYLGEVLIFLGRHKEGEALLNEVAKKDRSGAGEFALALLEAIKAGFNPQKRVGKDRS